MLLATAMTAQDFSAEQLTQGYARENDHVWFVFDPELYEVKPKRVSVTGTFRHWDSDMENKNWLLQPLKNGIWGLRIDNKNWKALPPLSEFKYMVDKGEWLNPPLAATNTKGSNLVFMDGFKVPQLKPEIRKPRLIWASIRGYKRSLRSKDYRLTDAEGREIPIVKILPNTSTETLFIPGEDLDIRRVYFLEYLDLQLKSFCSFDGWFRELYSDKELGANISDDGSRTTFRIFAPRATGMKLYLYKKPDDTRAYRTLEMRQDPDGVWETEINGNLKGVYYDFTVHGFTDPGSHFYEVDPVHISDPYARVSMDTWGKCRVWEKTTPATPLKDGIPAMEDIISYEVHVQDFTDLLPVSDDLKGTIPAMTKPGLRNSKGEKIGFDYLLDLGINVLHLMPVQEYFHFPDDDWKASFKDDPYMIEQGVSEENYQWGYRTSHCFAIESHYRQRGTEPGMEREQFRDLVQTFHDHDIAVIIDIVPNHTAENMDGNHFNFHFNALDMLYYYRTRDFEHIGAFGNEVKTENRPMVQRWLIDQCKHFIEEFGIDGFRIDLAGQIDQQTLIALKEALGPDIIVYGEPWMGSNDPEFEANPDWDWYKEDAPITFFQDEARNAFKGPVFKLEDKKKDRGYAGGNFEERENVKKALTNTFADDKKPSSGINYLDIHDNWALADRFAKKDWDGRFGVEEDRFKIAATLLYTSVGPIVTHGGTEMMRSKGAAPLGEVVKETKAGYKIHFHGKRDTYNHRTANQFIWENVGRTPAEDGIYCDYKSMYAFWRGLNQFRKSEYGKLFRINHSVTNGHFSWIAPGDQPYLLGYVVGEKVLVMMNVDDQAHRFPAFTLPEGNWKLIGNNSGVDLENGVKDPVKSLERLKGGKELKVEMEGTGVRIWVRRS